MSGVGGFKLLSILLWIFACPAQETLSETINKCPGNVTSNVNTRGRAFPIFTVVTFPNALCTGRGTFNGTCLSTKECRNSGGVISGGCASGYGACCVSRCGTTTRANVTYFVNAAYPNASTESRSCVVRVQKLNSNVVQLRLDFDIFSTNGVINGTCSSDVFSVTGHNVDQVIPAICGQNNGQHIYVNVGRSSGPINLAVTTSGSGNRLWRIRVVQLERGNPGLAPTDCLQYFTGPSGLIKSFNFDSPTPPSGQANYINNLNYAMCIGREVGNCQSRFTATNESNSFDLETPDAMSGVDGSCLGDYLVIPGSINARVADAEAVNTPIGSRFCGVALSATPASDVSNPIISRLSGPLQLAFVTNGQTSPGSSDRGFSLRYQQIPCISTSIVEPSE